MVFRDQATCGPGIHSDQYNFSTYNPCYSININSPQLLTAVWRGSGEDTLSFRSLVLFKTGVGRRGGGGGVGLKERGQKRKGGPRIETYINR
jgi:hypothetical protein